MSEYYSALQLKSINSCFYYFCQQLGKFLRLPHSTKAFHLMMLLPFHNSLESVQHLAYWIQKLFPIQRIWIFKKWWVLQLSQNPGNRPAITNLKAKAMRYVYQVKLGFFQKVLANFSNFSKCHSCEPKIVSEFLIPVNDNNKILVILWIDLVIKSPHYEIWLKNTNYIGELHCLQCLQSQEIIDYTLNTYLNKLFID